MMDNSNYEYENENDASQMGGFLAGLLIGGLIGAGVMLFLAPQSGEKMRAKIRKESAQQRDQMVKTVEGAASQARDKANRIKKDMYAQTGKLEQRGQTMIDEQRNNLSKTLKDLGKTVKP